MIKRILLGLGGHEYTPTAVRYAVELAQAHESTITGVAITDLARLQDVGPIPLGGATAAAELREHRLNQHAEALEQAKGVLTAACQPANVAFDIYEATGNTVDLVAKLARYHDLSIGGLKAIFEGATIDEPPNELIHLITAGIRPIVAVPEEYREINKVLIAYSGSMESAKTMKHFVRFHPWANASLKIVHFGADNDDSKQLIADASAYCAAYGFSAETEVIDANPASELLPHAESWGADMIVTGNSAKSLLRRRIFGETALTAIQNSKLPLFLSQ